MEKVKILLAEDHLVVRNGIKLLLDTQQTFQVIADVNNGKQVLDLLDSGVETDIVLTDIGMLEMDGMQLIQELAERYPQIKVIVLTMLDCEQYVTRAFESGAKGYLIKNVGAEEMIFCIKHVSNGGRYLCEELSMSFVEKAIVKNNVQPIVSNPVDFDLSEREQEVLNLLGEGYTNQEIAKMLFISKRTVEGHRQNLIEKTKAKNTPALIKFAVLMGLIR
ncbi:response regulator [Sphingobacterium sp. DK4209]|uniref:Response regulator n=2 Tax=Sphingobacterium zhuxiongii TaxID=2662364 RepID=A0A5Q0QJH4_9SPHI|nr:response regulator [Sphingobacterium sp. DK4209]QGA28242.1 response regulator [Sphingobacterium sp. dk4302]